MARFQLFAAEGDGLLLDLQSDLFETFGTRVMVPLVPVEAAPPAIGRLHPVFSIDARRYVMVTHLVASVPVERLDRPRGDLSGQRERIEAALDMLFRGF